MSSDDLVKRAMEGERDAFGELIRQYEKPLFVFLYRKAGDRDLVLDLIQETFIDAFVAISGLRDPERFPGWLFTIARRKAWLARRKARDWDEMVEPIPVVCSATDEVLREELSEVVRKAVRTLPEKMREVVQMHYLDEMPYPEVCERLGIPVSTLKSRLHLARERLREELAPFVEDMPEVSFALRRRKALMKFTRPEIKIGEVPGVEMEVEVVEPPNRCIRLEEGAEGGGVWFRNWADGKNDHVYLVFKSRVVGRALVEGEECWEVEEEIRTPQDKHRSTTFRFEDRREDGFYLFASVYRGEGRMPELYFASAPVSPNFPIRLNPGMESSAFGRRKRVERVVDVQINGKMARALEVVYPAASFEGEGGKVLRLNRTYIGEDGRNVLFQRYHSIEERASGLLPDDVPEIEYEGTKYLLYHYSLPMDYATQ